MRRNSAAFSAMDVDGMLACYAPDAVVVDRRPHGMGTFRGHDELRPYYLSIFHSADTLREDLRVLAHAPGVVVAHCELWGRMPGDTGAGVTIPYGMVLTIAEGLIRQLDIYTDGEDALSAAAPRLALELGGEGGLDRGGEGLREEGEHGLGGDRT